MSVTKQVTMRLTDQDKANAQTIIATGMARDTTSAVQAAERVQFHLWEGHLDRMDSRDSRPRISRSQTGVSHSEGDILGEPLRQTQGARSSGAERRTHNLPFSSQRGSEGRRRDLDEVVAATGPLTPGETVGSVVLALEDRLLVALAARGHLRIGQFIHNALAYQRAMWGADDFYSGFFYLSDEDLVLALEEAVGDVDG